MANGLESYTTYQLLYELDRRGVYCISFSRDRIRAVRGEALTNDECDFIAEELTGLFDTGFRKNARDVELWA